MAKRQLDDTLRLWGYAFTEVVSMREFMEDDGLNNPVYRRILLRNLFSVIETFSFISRELIKIKLSIDGDNGELTLAEQFLLQEKRASLDSKGSVALKDEFQAFIPSLKFTLNSFAKVFGSVLPDYGDSNFEKLKHLSKRRNEVTHPKSYLDVNISNGEMQDIIAMFGWFMDTRSKLEEPFMKWMKATYPTLKD